MVQGNWDFRIRADGITTPVVRIRPPFFITVHVAYSQAPSLGGEIISKDVRVSRWDIGLDRVLGF